MKFKKIIFSLISIILLALVLSVVYYNMNNMTLEEAISDSNVPIDQIFHSTDYKGHIIIFYNYDDILSAGLIGKTPLGYRWGFGVGSRMFGEEKQILNRGFSNLHPKDIKTDDELVSLMFGVIYDDSIEKLKIKYKDLNITEATIIETNKGRIWYSFSDTPINYDPEVIRIYKDGTEISGW